MKVPEGYVAFIEELPGANTQGATLDEARENLKEAAALVLDANRAMAQQSLEGAAVIRETFVLPAAWCDCLLREGTRNHSVPNAESNRSARCTRSFGCSGHFQIKIRLLWLHNGKPPKRKPLGITLGQREIGVFLVFSLCCICCKIVFCWIRSICCSVPLGLSTIAYSLDC
jgi:hypothetical protein